MTETSGYSLVQAPAQNRVTYARFFRYMCCPVLNTFKDENSTSLASLIAVFDNFHSKKGKKGHIGCGYWNFVCLGLCSFPCFLSLRTTEKSLAMWLHLLYTSPFMPYEAFINIDCLNLLFSRLNSVSPLRVSSYTPDAPLP